MLTELKKQSFTKSVLLHICPGAIQMLTFVILIPIVLNLGFPSLMADNIVAIIAMVPIQFGILFHVAKRQTGTYQIMKLFPFQEKSKFFEYVIFIAIMLLWALAVSAVLTPFENGLRDGLFSFVPNEIAMRTLDAALYSKDKLIISAAFLMLTNGVIAPITEELFFRGYLLPRIKASPIVAVIINSVLFSLYHFFSPWYFSSRVLMTIPVYYWVVKQKNIRFSIAAHMIANLFGSISGVISLLS